MNKSLIVVCLLASLSSSMADINSRLNVSTQDGTQSNWPYQLIVTNGQLTDNANGTMTLSVGSGTLTSIIGTPPINSSGGSSPVLSLSQTIGQYENFASSVTFSGHIISSGTVPSVSACGTSPAIAGTDTAGTITIGGGVSVTSCAMNFASAWANAPACVASDNNTGTNVDIASVTTSSVTFNFSLSLVGGSVWYICMGQKG